MGSTATISPARNRPRRAPKPPVVGISATSRATLPDSTMAAIGAAFCATLRDRFPGQDFAAVRPGEGANVVLAVSPAR